MPADHCRSGRRSITQRVSLVCGKRTSKRNKKGKEGQGLIPKDGVSRMDGFKSEKSDFILT